MKAGGNVILLLGENTEDMSAALAGMAIDPSFQVWDLLRPVPEVGNLVIDRALDQIHHRQVAKVMRQLGKVEGVVVIGTHNPAVIDNLVVDDIQRQVYLCKGATNILKMTDTQALRFHQSYKVGIQQVHEILVDLGVD